MLLDRMLTRLFAGGHRVLLFSRYVRMLNILEDYMNLSRVRYERIDGSVASQQRQAAIDRFNAPNSPAQVFLLSTGACRLGARS
jgi:SNF2 family DNA or RNA helicase